MIGFHPPRSVSSSLQAAQDAARDTSELYANRARNKKLDARDRASYERDQVALAHLSELLCRLRYLVDDPDHEDLYKEELCASLGAFLVLAQKRDVKDPLSTD